MILAFGLAIAVAAMGSHGAPSGVWPAADLPGRPAAPDWAEAPDGAVLLAWEQRESAGSSIYFRRVERDLELSGATAFRLDGIGLTPGRSLEPRVAAGGKGLVLAAWQDSRGKTPHIRVRRSADGGRTWPAEAALVSTLTAAATMPSVAIGGEGRAWIAWEDRRDGDRDVYFACSTDGAGSWQSPRRVETDEPGAASSFHPQLLALADRVLLIVWWDERNGLSDLWVRRSTDGGASWAGPEQRLDVGEPGRTASRTAHVGETEGRIAVSWREGSAEERLERTSTDRGATWTEPSISKTSTARSPVRVEIVTVDDVPGLVVTRARER